MKRSFLGKDADCDLDAHGQDKDAYVPRVLDHKVDIICGMLEVYMDELLSHPDLSEVFLWTQDEADKGVLSFSRQREIVLEAACAHALVSRRRIGRVRRAELPVGSPPLTLTAAVLLLDLVVEDGAHQEFLTHVADLVRRSVDELDVVLWRRSSQVMNDGVGIFEGSTSEDSTQTTWVAGCDEMLKLVDVVDPTKTLDWLKGDTSWPSQQSPDLAERLHPRLSVHLTLSILESAVRLYAQADVSSCLHQRNAWDGKKGSARSSSCGCSFSSDLKQTDELFCSPVHVQRDVHSLGNLLNGLRDSSTLNSNQQQEFVAAMLHLMSSSLYRIAAELRRMRQLSATNDPLGTELEREIGITVSCVSAVFRSSLAGAQQIPPAVKNLFSDRLEESSAEDLKESIRFTWKSLSDVVRREVKEGVADHLLDEYFHVLKSLLVLVREGDRHADPKDGHCIDIDQIARSQQFESIAAEPDEESRVLTGFGRTLNSGLATPANPGNQMSPATLRIFQKLKGRKPQTSTPESGRSSDMDPNKVCDQIVSSLSSTLSSQERSNKRSRVSRDISSVCTGVNPYVQSCIASDKSMDGDTFEDLNDFIVCKEGRNYVKWKKERQKFVARRRARNIWKRMEEREKLLAKLALTETE